MPPQDHVACRRHLDRWRRAPPQLGSPAGRLGSRCGARLRRPDRLPGLLSDRSHLPAAASRSRWSRPAWPRSRAGRAARRARARRLVAWRIRAGEAATHPYWIVFLHGNDATRASDGNVTRYHQLRSLGLNVIAPEYPGYADVAGEPSEAGLHEAARAAYDCAAPRAASTDAASRSTAGRSAPAAPRRSPATSTKPRSSSRARSARCCDARRRRIPICRSRGWCSHPFLSEDAIAAVGSPILFLHSPEDAIIPFDDGQRLFARARAPKQLVALARRPHHAEPGRRGSIPVEHLHASSPTEAGWTLTPPRRSTAVAVRAAFDRGGAAAARSTPTRAAAPRATTVWNLAEYRARARRPPPRARRAAPPTAIAILRANAEVFPVVAAALVHLGRAYAAADDAARAREALRALARARWRRRATRATRRSRRCAEPIPSPSRAVSSACAYDGSHGHRHRRHAGHRRRLRARLRREPAPRCGSPRPTRRAASASPRELTAAGPDARVSCRVTSPATTIAARSSRQAATTDGRLDCLVNNAGWHPPHHPIDASRSTTSARLLELNVVSVFALCQLALPHLRADARLDRQHRQPRRHASASTTPPPTSPPRAPSSRSPRRSRSTKRSTACASTRSRPATSTRRCGSRPSTPPPTAPHARADGEAAQVMGRMGTPEEVGRLCLYLAADATFTTGVDHIISGGAEIGYGRKA